MGQKIGFLGGGNMGSAIIAGLLRAKIYEPQDILVYDIRQEVLHRMASELRVRVTVSTEALTGEADVLVLALKPQVLPEVLEKIHDHISADTLVISIAAGVSLAKLTSWLSPEHKLVRVMPNTPALVGEGMAGVCANENVEPEEFDRVLAMFRSLGRAEAVPESRMDAVVGVSGSGPAYVYMFIEALADGAVREGMPRAQAYTFAAQTVLGSAKMVLESGKHPAELKDMVCSPAGTTIDAVDTLEKNAFRSAVMQAVHAAAEKNRSM